MQVLGSKEAVDQLAKALTVFIGNDMCLRGRIVRC